MFRAARPGTPVTTGVWPVYRQTAVVHVQGAVQAIPPARQGLGVHGSAGNAVAQERCRRPRGPVHFVRTRSRLHRSGHNPGRHPFAEIGTAQGRAGAPPGPFDIAFDGLAAVLRLRSGGALFGVGEGCGHLRMQVAPVAPGAGT